jgi:hypothetical protein
MKQMNQIVVRKGQGLLLHCYIVASTHTYMWRIIKEVEPVPLVSYSYEAPKKHMHKLLGLHDTMGVC